MDTGQPRSHAIEMVFIVPGHAGGSAKSFMLSLQIYIFFKLCILDPVQSLVTKCPHLYLNCSRACGLMLGQLGQHWVNMFAGSVCWEC